jgi:hypothetical protein
VVWTTADLVAMMERLEERSMKAAERKKLIVMWFGLGLSIPVFWWLLPQLRDWLWVMFFLWVMTAATVPWRRSSIGPN